MIRIVKRGKTQEELFRGECQSCGCEAEAQRSDVLFQADRDGDLFHIVCPQCKRAGLYVTKYNGPR